MRPLLEQWIVQLQRLIIAGKWLAALLPKASTANTAAALGMRYSCTHAAIAMGLWLHSNSTLCQIGCCWQLLSAAVNQTSIKGAPTTSTAHLYQLVL
eukprot:14526-Heterococcus_DN1.PRE.3